MKTCEYYQRLLSESLDDDLTEEQADEVEKHLIDCVACRAFQRISKNQAVLTRQLPMVDCSDNDGKVNDLSKPAYLKQFWSARLSVPLPVAAAVLLLVLGISGWGLMKSGGSPTSSPPLHRGMTQIEQIQIMRFEPQSALLQNDVSNN